jgi:hypothetical protein
MRVIGLTCVAVVLLMIAFVRGEDTIEAARGAQGKADELVTEMMQRMQAVEEDINKKKIPLFEQRNNHLKSIDGFWSRVLLNHPNHGAWVAGNDRAILPFVTDLKVDTIDVANHQYKITLSLKQNPYIANTELWRKISGTDTATQEVSGVEWLGDNRPAMQTFFSYFDNKDPRWDDMTVNDITHVLQYEFYQNPFTYHDIPTFDELAAEHHATGNFEENYEEVPAEGYENEVHEAPVDEPESMPPPGEEEHIIDAGEHVEEPGPGPVEGQEAPQEQEAESF